MNHHRRVTAKQFGQTNRDRLPKDMKQVLMLCQQPAIDRLIMGYDGELFQLVDHDTAKRRSSIVYNVHFADEKSDHSDSRRIISSMQSSTNYGAPSGEALVNEQRQLVGHPMAGRHLAQELGDELPPNLPTYSAVHFYFQLTSGYLIVWCYVFGRKSGTTTAIKLSSSNEQLTSCNKQQRFITTARKNASCNKKDGSVLMQSCQSVSVMWNEAA
jgi:hypothetical protein